LLVLLKRQYSARYRILGREITTHGIESDFHGLFTRRPIL
jgi:hypothetical protein